tara:strand:+ start:3771 stop:4199 length:429 start_codon:yes stop_codon:yes gene_type:complete
MVDKKQESVPVTETKPRYYLPNAEFLDFWMAQLESDSKIGMEDFIVELRKKFDKMVGSLKDGEPTWKNSDAVAADNVPTVSTVRSKMRMINKKITNQDKHPYFRGMSLRIPKSTVVVRPPLDEVLSNQIDRIRKLMNIGTEK